MGGEEANARQYGARMSRTCAFLSLTLLPQLAAGGVWRNCEETDYVLMSFPEPHGKGWPTGLSTTWGRDTTKLNGAELDGYVRVDIAV